MSDCINGLTVYVFLFLKDDCYVVFLAPDSLRQCTDRTVFFSHISFSFFSVCKVYTLDACLCVIRVVIYVNKFEASLLRSSNLKSQ